MTGNLLVWVFAASFLGFAISAIFAGWMKLSRNRFLVSYVILAAIFLYSFVLANHLDLRAILTENLVWGFLTGMLVSIFLVINVKSQPASRQSEGAKLAFDITWPGFIYGLVDALFLNVMPVVAVFLATAQLPWTGSLLGKVIVAILALVASLLVTLTYHLGYPEFRNKRVLMVLVGNSLITLAYLVSGNPFGSLISHSVMHMAAVLQGPETTIQLPPHHRPYFELG